VPQPRRQPTAQERGVRDQLRRVVNPLDIVVLTRARLQEVIDEAVERGRITRGDAADLVADLLARGRNQADDLIGELEQLVARGPLEAARRVAGLDPEFPVTGYDELTAAEVVRELDGMAPADLRKIRQYERANANRKSVLAAVDRKLA
jgi:polyhydroxyalkanoate synthesis regulator phasin